VLGAAISSVAFVAIGGSSLSQADASTRTSQFFGMNAQYVFKLPEAQWDSQLASIAGMGIGMVREDASWSGVERTPPVGGQHRYNWSKPDAEISALARHGLRWYPILDYSTTWDATLSGPLGWKSAPIDPAYFAAYAAAFAQRYGPGGSFWVAHPSLQQLPVQTFEIWNEPNLDQFWPTVSGAADRYGDLLAATMPAIRAVDPTAEVVVGGLSPTGLVEFLNEIEAGHPGLIAQMDAVAFHPYGTTFTNTGARVRVLREWLDAHGAGALPIEITETGWATPPLSEGERAVRMSTLVQGLSLSSCDITRIIPYTWLTFEGEASNPEEWFGIANANATLKPTGAALGEAIQAVRNGTATATSDPCAGLNVPPRKSQSPAESGSGLGPVAPGSGSESGAVASGRSSATTTSPASSPPSVPLAVSPVAVGDSPSVAKPVSTLRRKTASGIVVDVRRHGQAIVVQVKCSRACRSIVRLTRSGHPRVRASASPVLQHRYRTTIRLSGSSHAVLVVRVTVQIPGFLPQTLVRRLARRDATPPRR
jgi:polysaccharide biosynthesis protein PslG